MGDTQKAAQLAAARAQLAAEELSSQTDELGDFFVAPLAAHVAELEQTIEDDDIDVSIRLDDVVALKLAMFAHEAGLTLNDLVVDVLAIAAEGWELRRRGSRNGREGRLVGRFAGGYVRTTVPQFQIGKLDRGMATAVWLHRNKRRG